MKTFRQRWDWALAAAAALALLLCASFVSVAQDSPAPPDAQAAPVSQDSPDAPAPDPPSRVARLDSIDGSVSFQPGGENDWVDAVLNRPLVTGDNLWADENSRAEVHIGSTALRLGSQTGITLLELSDRATQIRLAQGSLIVRVRHVDDEDSYEVDTPNIAFVILQEGEYRLDVSTDGARTDVTVFHGRGEVTGGGSSYPVVADQHSTFTGTGTDQLSYALGQIPPQDDLDNWAFDRDNREDNADSANYVSREMTGYEDLDDNGSWAYVAGYGTVWRPMSVAVGWAPYRFGHWAWIAPWGWTWVEAEPWGFAPFHYGRWAFAGGGWFWIPGPSVVRPVYAPALVAWVGGGAGSNFSFAFGPGVGWFPLAPGEVFIPGYRVSRVYVNRVNFTNTSVDMTTVSNAYNRVAINRMANNMAYANRGVSGGVTVVSHDTFVNARPVARNIQAVSAKEIESAPVVRTASAEPVRQSMLGAGRPAVNRPPAAVISRTVVALRTPAAMPRSFDQSQRAGQSLIRQELVRQEPAGRPATPAAGSRPSQNDEGFRSFAPPTPANQPKTEPRVWEAQGTPEPERSSNSGAENRASQPARTWSNPLAKPVAPVRRADEQQQQDQEQKFSKWQQQRPAPAPAKQPAAHPSNPSHSSSSKKGH
jgi:hypothetical protein